MSNQPKLIDADKLREFLHGFDNGWIRGSIPSLIYGSIQRGDFDPDPIPLPSIKPGDKVRHSKRGEGIALKVYDEKIIANFDGVSRECKPSDLEVIE